MGFDIVVGKIARINEYKYKFDTRKLIKNSLNNIDLKVNV